MYHLFCRQTTLTKEVLSGHRYRYNKLFQDRIIISRGFVGSDSRKQTTMSSSLSEQEVAHWDGLWQEGIEKGTRWDVGHAEPELVYEVKEGILKPKTETARALVPGCGRGYAVKALAELGYSQAVGLELSAKAVQIAQEDSPHPAAKYLEGDFFKTSPDRLGGEAFDLIFDSTFLCAIPPTLREQWASQMVSLLKNDGGLLAMNVFPVARDPQAPEIGLDGPFGEGPPYRLSLQLVKTLFKPFDKEMKLILCKEVPIERQSRAPLPGKWGDTITEHLMVWERRTG